MSAALARDIKTQAQHAADAVAEMRDRRAVARGRAIGTMRRIERFVGIALGGETLRGLRRMVAGKANEEIVGANVRAKEIDDMCLDGHTALFIGEDGLLHMVDLTEWPKVATRVAHDDDLMAQDLLPYMHALQAAMKRHVERVERTTASYAKISDLATRIGESLTDPA